MATSRPFIQRWIDIVVLVLRILLWPLRQLSEYAFPTSDMDGLSPAVTAKAAQHFVTYLRTLQQQQQQQQNHHPHHSTSSTGTSGSTSAGGSSTNNHLHQQHGSTTNGAILTEAWVTTGFAAARQMAMESQSLIFLYLHAPIHRSSRQFCQRVLLSEQVQTFFSGMTAGNSSGYNHNTVVANQHWIALGVSIHTAQGAQLQQLLKVTAFPFCAVLQPQLPNGTTSSTTTTNASTTATSAPNSMNTTSSSSSSSSSSNHNNRNSNSSIATAVMNLLFRAEGMALYEIRIEILLGHLHTALQRHQMILTERETRRILLQQESELRKQQEEEYLIALQADQERERNKRTQEEREQMEQKNEMEKVKQIELAKEEALALAMSLVKPEPSTGGTMIRFVLPSGMKLNRRFHQDDTIGHVKAYLKLYFHEHHIQIEQIGLSTSFPRTCYDNQESLSLQDAGLIPQAVLMVQDLDA